MVLRCKSSAQLSVTGRNADTVWARQKSLQNTGEDRQNRQDRLEFWRLVKMEVPCVVIEYDYGESRHRSMRKIFPRRMA